MRKNLYILFLLVQIQLVQIVAQTNNELDSTVKSFLEGINAYKGPSIEELPVDIGRQAMVDLQKEKIEKSSTAVDTTTLFIKGNTKKSIELIIIKPKDYKEKLPVLMYFHSGGWVFNGYDTHKRLMAELAIRTKRAIVFVSYSRSPEVVYPTANEEAYIATRWIAKNGNKYGLNTNRISVGGGSAGGNMATVVAMMAKNRKEVKIESQLLFYPVTDTNVNTTSYQKFAKGYYLQKSTMVWFIKTYAPSKATHQLPTIAPLKASLKQLKNMPKALIITAGFDVLRDEGEAYAKKLKEAGVSVISTRYGGMIHDFLVLNALKNTKSVEVALKQVADFLK